MFLEILVFFRSLIFLVTCLTQHLFIVPFLNFLMTLRFHQLQKLRSSLLSHVVLLSPFACNNFYNWYRMVVLVVYQHLYVVC